MIPDGAREALARAELARSKGRSTPDTCPHCPPEAHVCHHEDEMRAWGDLPDVAYTNDQAADRALAALSAAGYVVTKADETWTEYGRRTAAPEYPPNVEGRALPSYWRKSALPWCQRTVSATTWEQMPGEDGRCAEVIEQLRAEHGAGPAPVPGDRP